VLHIKTELGNRKISEPGQESPDLTNERKIMSTKTLRKRIALVAVSAMGFGLLTSVSANADYAAGQLTLTASGTGVSNSGLCTSEAVATAASAALSRPIAVGGTQQFTLGTNGSGRAEITGPGTWAAGATAGTLDGTNTVLTFTTDSSKAVLKVNGTGQIVVRAYATATSTSALDTFYFTGLASCTAGVSAAKSQIQLTSDSTHVKTNADYAAGTAIGSATLTSAKTLDNSNDDSTLFANDGTAYIHIVANDSYGVPYTTSSSLTVSCTNNATVGGSKGGSYYLGSTSTGYWSIAVTQPTSGTPLKTTCTVSLNGVVLGTKTLTIVGDLAKITATPLYSGDAEGSTTNLTYGVIKYYYYDAAGNTVTASGNLPKLTSSTITTVTNQITTVATTTTSVSGVTVRTANGGAAGASEVSGRLAFNCLDFGVSPISVYAVNASAQTITSNVVNAACGGPTFTYSASLDKSSYNTGEVATLTIKALSYDGKTPVASNVTLGTGAAVSLGGMTAAQTIATTDALSDGLAGTWTYQFTVGQTAGSYSGAVKVNLGSAYATVSPMYGKTATVSYSIKDAAAGVSNAEVLAAIVKLIASINKQIAALQKALTKKK